MKKYKLLAQGGYGNIYLDPVRMLVCKRIPKYTIKGQYILYSTIVEAIVTAFVQTFPGVPFLRGIEVKDDHVAISMEHHGETLNRWISRAKTEPGVPPGRERRDEAYAIMRGLITTLLHFKSSNILHTDIKPCNVLISQDFPIKVTLIDFNCASVAKVEYVWGGITPRIIYSCAMSTYNFAAPELVFTGRPTEQSCVWSLGLIACMIFGGGYPISSCMTHNADRQWKNTQKEWKTIFLGLQGESSRGSDHMIVPPYILQNMGDDFKLTSWVIRAFSWEPTARPSLEEIATAMLGTPLPRMPLPVYEPIANPNKHPREVRGLCIERLFSVAMDTKKQSWFATSVYILDCITTDKIEEDAAACWVISGCLHNCYVLDDDTQVDRILHYFHVKPSLVTDRVWKLCSTEKWNLWARPLDVVLLEEYNITFSFTELKDIFTAMNQQWTPSTYAAILAIKNTSRTT